MTNLFQEFDWNKSVFSDQLIQTISKGKLWNIWLPKSMNGLALDFSEGLEILRSISTLDGSLGWTITLCSGANFFLGNLKPEVVKEILNHTPNPIFGGSGGAFGLAIKTDDGMFLDGTWHYATGSAYLTHFTLNAKIMENGEIKTDEDGNPIIRSFIIPSQKVEIIEDWNTMGLKATVTHSFKVDKLKVEPGYSFKYDHFYSNHPIFKIPFRIFSDLTLMVNYLGISKHFLDLAIDFLSDSVTSDLKNQWGKLNELVFDSAVSVELDLKKENDLKERENEFEELHEEFSRQLSLLTNKMVEIHPLLGIKASREDSEINMVFKDYFTATQHHNFVKR